MKYYLWIFLLIGSWTGYAQNTTDANFKKANQSYVFFESERDKGSVDAAYGYLLDSYAQFMKVAEAPDNKEYIQTVKIRLKTIYPFLEKATVYYAEARNGSKTVDFAMPYMQLPKIELFQNELLQRSDKYASIIYSAGIAAYKTQKYNQAIELFQEYINTGETQFLKDSYIYQNMVYQEQKDYKKQEILLERAHTRFPIALDFLYNLVNVHIATQNMDKLKAVIEKILTIDPNNEKVLPIKARLLESAGENKEALQIYQRLHKLYPDDFELLTGLARANFNYATEIINGGVTIVDDNQYAVVRQKAAEYLLDAKDLFIRILEKTPASKQYMLGLANVYQYMDEGAEYQVLTQMITDGVDFSHFNSRLLAYNKEQQEKNVQQEVEKADDKAPLPTNPPRLVIHIDSIDDGNHNRIIDAGESFALTFTVQNSGEGDAYNIRVRFSEQQGLDAFFDGAKELDGGNILSGKSKQYTMRYIISKDLPENDAIINLYAFEANGFDADPAELAIHTLDYAMPRLNVADYQFLAYEGTSIKIGERGKLTLALRNDGSVTANRVKVVFSLPNNIFATDSPETYIDSITPGGVSIVECGFSVNKRFDHDSISVAVAVSEPTRSSFVNDVFKAKLGDYLATTNTLRIDGLANTRKPAVVPEDFSLTFKSELTENIPDGAKHPHRYALIFGNEDYSMAGSNAEINVPYAVNDAVVFQQYCIRAFGIPDKQVKMAANATAGIMHEQLDWLVNMASADPEAELFFFFSGHGNNDEKTKDAYLIPVDVSGKNIRFGISLEELYGELAKYPVKASYVFLDACFSGGFKGEASLVAQKAVRVVPKVGVPRGNTISITSSSGDQTSGVFHDKKQGYFTYYLIKSIQDSSGDITLKDLFEQTSAAVRKATALTGKLQEPSIVVSPTVNFAWEDLRLQTINDMSR